MGKYIHIQISGKINKVTGLRYRLRIMFKINVREDRIGNQEWTIQRNRQHCAHKTEDEDITNYKNTAQKPKKGEQPGQCQKQRKPGAREGYVVHENV